MTPLVYAIVFLGGSIITGTGAVCGGWLIAREIRRTTDRELAFAQGAAEDLEPPPAPRSRERTPQGS